MAADDAREREREESRARIEAGGLPLAAERRLRALREAPGGLFTSDLSVDEAALGGLLGLRPVSQVMGSSFHKVGWLGLGWTVSAWTGTSSVGFEVEPLSRAWNEARRRALDRLDEEARLAGADAVVGVRVTEARHDWAADAVEFTAIGTAVQVPGADPHAAPVLTDLSGQEYFQLVRAGFRPVGLVAATAVYYVQASWSTQRLTGRWFQPNAELSDFTQGVYEARELALRRLTSQAEGVRASGVVGVRVTQSQETHRVDTGNAGPTSHREDLIVTFHVIGTAIAGDAAGPAFAPEAVVRRGGGS